VLVNTFYTQIKYSNSQMHFKQACNSY